VRRGDPYGIELAGGLLFANAGVEKIGYEQDCSGGLLAQRQEYMDFHEKWYGMRGSVAGVRSAAL
jgi:hypothetical protein